MNKTIKADTIEIIEIKKSKFIGYTFYCETVNQANNFLTELKKEHKKATHVCFAYVINSNEKASDDGEPQGTAGLPILEVIKKQNLTNVLCVVVRYFGGIKLGAGGLIRAYSETAAQTVKKSEGCNLCFATEYTICLNYGDEQILNNLKNNVNVINVKVDYNQNITINFFGLDGFDENSYLKYNLIKGNSKLVRV